ncbi:hypothetical protein SEPCBS119000_004530 [Sporothrix epigloea]|uniref:F-box domain-containing protein n=1 Tax=Sporothrix epigloea TaxID=1892477 RepID=A0ABP0DSS0_9PEZI
MPGGATLEAVTSSDAPSSSPAATLDIAPEIAKTASISVHEEVLLPTETAQTANSAPVEYGAQSRPQKPLVVSSKHGYQVVLSPSSHTSAIISSTLAPPAMTSATVSSLPSAHTPAGSLAQAASPALLGLEAAPAMAPVPNALALNLVCGNPHGPASSTSAEHPKLPLRAAASEKLTAMVVPHECTYTKKPLTLLELPTDVLRLIVKELVHTNDLTSLGLAHSTLYQLVIPQLYARFDIVWPDPTGPPPEGRYVDALTYGLTTLCLGSTFARTLHRHRKNLQSRARMPQTVNRKAANALFGSTNYAQHTRKFSLGNGPAAWFADYMLDKEAGRMLGTLVALSVAKMQNLENFVWDMPTGVLSDVFLALATLPDFDHLHNECKLDRLWIRLHNNSINTRARSSRRSSSSPSSSPELPPAPPQLFVPQGSNLTPFGILLPPHGGHPRPQPTISYSSSQVEYPTFSVVPPLRSLSVLDIDEIAYLDELAVLIERSCSRLRELRIGIANHAVNKDFVQIWDGTELQQVDFGASWPGESTIGDRRLGGVLGILVGRTYDLREKQSSTKTLPDIDSGTAIPATVSGTDDANTEAGDVETIIGDWLSAKNVSATSSPQAESLLSGMTLPDGTGAAANDRFGATGSTTRDEDEDGYERHMQLDRKLKLTTLELERVPLSIQVLVRAIDWTGLTTLTLLGCPQNQSLWRQLSRHFRPTPAAGHGYGISAVPARLASKLHQASLARDYHLALKSIHTDIVSKSLLSFIRDTLAPNTLEVLILQNHLETDVSLLVSAQDIFKSAVKPHSASLQKLLIDGHVRPQVEHSSSQQHPENTHRRRLIWLLDAGLIKYLTSGRLTSLREVGFSLHYRDWHTFLQRLPSLPQLRSLHILHIFDHIVGTISKYDLAMQVADIATLRPEFPLCFVALFDKCYEVIETHGSDSPGGDADVMGNGGVVHEAGAGGVAIDESSDTASSLSDDEGEDDDAGSEGDFDGAIGGNVGANGMHAVLSAGHDSDADLSDSGDSNRDSQLLDDELPESRPLQLRLREIFFYDDKVAIFKARHARL